MKRLVFTADAGGSTPSLKAMLIALLAGCQVAPSAMAQGAAALAVRPAVEEAVRTHPLLRSATGQLLQADEGIAEARAGYYPQISGGVGSTLRRHAQSGYDDRHVHQAQLSVSQTLYDFGKVDGDVGYAQAQRDAARSRVLLAIDELARSTAQAWIEVHRQQALAAVAQQQVEQVRKLAELTAEREAKGASTRSDLVQARARVELAEVELLSAQAQAQRWRTNLQHLTGRQTPPEITGAPPDVLQAACGRGLNDLAQQQGQILPPAVQAAQAEVEAARAALRVADAQLRPTLSVEAGVQQPLTSGSRYQGRSGPDASVGLNFSAPLYQGGRNQSRQRAAEHAVAAATASLDQARLAATQNLQDAVVQWQEHAQRAGVQAQRVENMQTTRELYRQQYLQLGTRTLLDLLNAEQEYHGARSQVVASEHEQHRLAVECLYQTGRLREAFALDELAAQAARLAEQR